MTGPFYKSPFVADPDYSIWLPALRPVGVEGGDLDLEQWATKTANYFIPEGETAKPVYYERIHKQLMIFGSQDFPSWDPMWQDKWIHFPDCADVPLPLMLSDYDVNDNGSEEELRQYLRVGDPLLIEEPIVEEVHTALGRGLRATAYSSSDEEGRGDVFATLAYVWRVETDDDLSIARLWAMYDPTRILKAADDIHNLAMTLRLRSNV